MISEFMMDHFHVSMLPFCNVLKNIVCDLRFAIETINPMGRSASLLEQ